MAIQRLLLLSTLLLLALFTISANARPCKTILFISSSSSSSSFSSNQNPNLLFSNPRFITFSYTTSLRQPITFSADGASLNRPFLISTPQKSTHNPVNFDSSVGNFIRDRMLDILSIVVVLSLPPSYIWFGIFARPGLLISVLMNLMRRMTMML